MTRKDFQLIAEVIATSWHASSDSRREMAENMAEALAGTNDRFNREMFLKACGVN
jgi:hypothetical protein